MKIAAPSLLLIGPRAIAKDVLGGTKISFEQLVDFFDQSEIWKTEVVNSSRANRRGHIDRLLANFRVFVGVVLQIIRKAGKSSVLFFNVSPRGLLFSGPVVWSIAKASKTPLVIRVFGGNFHEHFSASSKFVQWFARRTFLRCDLLLFQTKRLVEQYSSELNADWLPTSRSLTSTHRRRTACKRILFVSQLRPEKGIREFLEVSRLLPDDIEISIYGSEMAGFDPSVFEQYKNINYFGEKSHEIVLGAMQSHDLLVFPSYYEGEGYPGVIIEALQLGMPVVATRWKALPELIEHEKSGLLISPRSVPELLDAINRLRKEKDLICRLSDGAYERGQSFSGETVNLILDSKLRHLAGVRNKIACAG